MLVKVRNAAPFEYTIRCDGVGCDEELKISHPTRIGEEKRNRKIRECGWSADRDTHICGTCRVDLYT